MASDFVYPSSELPQPNETTPSPRTEPPPPPLSSKPPPLSNQAQAPSLSNPIQASPLSNPIQAPVPPGLSLPQDFPPLAAPSAPPPAPPHLQRKTTTGAAIKPVVPVLPTSSSRPAATSKETPSEEPEKPAEQAPIPAPISKKDDEASIGIPKDANVEPIESTKAGGPLNLSEIKEVKEAKGKKGSSSNRNVEKKQRPVSLDIAAAKEVPKRSAESKDPVGEASRVSAKAKSEGSNAVDASRPPTPATAVSQVSATSAIRQNQPRANRAPPMPKPEASSPGIVSSFKHPSRRESFSSTHRPGSPTSERMSDNVSYTSASLSRANSPPPSKVGSAPVRQLTKSQQKKERQARAKQAEGSSKAEEIPPKVVEVQAPIVGRKKKTKKQQTQSTADSTPTVTRPSSPALKEDIPEQKVATGLATPVKESKKGQSKAVAEIKEPETSSSPPTPAAEQQKPSLTAASIIASLLKAGEIPVSAADLFKMPAPGLNHRFETLEPDPSYLDALSEDQLDRLDQGEAIQLEKSPNHHIIVLPDRRQITGLTASQAFRYLELRKLALANGDSPSHQALESLLPTPPPTHLLATSSAATPDRIEKTKKLTNKFSTPAPPRSDSSANMRPTGAGVGGDSSSGGGVLTKRLVVGVVEAEQNLLGHRKEAEVLEKKLGALLKKNRRLVFGNAH